MKLTFRRNYPIILLLILIVAFLTLVMGNQRVIAYTTGNQAASIPLSAGDITNPVALFDDSIVHEIQVIIPDEDYDRMISTYQTTGEKDYFLADVIIDGVRVNEVGIRLKGNASLRSVLGKGLGGGNRPPNANNFMPGEAVNRNRQQPSDGSQQRQMPPGGQPFQAQQDGQITQTPAIDGQTSPTPQSVPTLQTQEFGQILPPNDGMQMPQGNPPTASGAPIPGFPQQNPPTETGNETEQGNGDNLKIPFLIRFDKYVSGQTYQGYSKLAIRINGTGNDASMLQEPVSNDMARLVGLPATRTAYTGFQINENAENLYVISEVVDDQQYLAQYFDNSNGVLFKAEIGSTLSYQGDDPSSYSRSFSQETRVNDADFAPLIKFIRFIELSDDATFEKELPERFDIDSFATYLAVNTALVNNDSMIGMNNNYYLYYDDTRNKFTLLLWDTNESLGKMGGGNRNANMNIPTLAGNRAGLGGKSQNNLLSRFLENTSFKALYEEKLAKVYQAIYLNGAIAEDVDRYQVLIHEVNKERSLVDSDTYDLAVGKVKSFITQRIEVWNNSQPATGN